MESLDTSRLFDQGADFVRTLEGYFTQPWTLYQLLIIAGCFVVGYLLSLKIEPALEERARHIKGNPRLLRVIVALLRRTEWILFLIMVAIIREVMLAVTWPSRSYLLSLALVLGFVWLTSTVFTRIIRNKAIARFVAICVFLYVATGVLGVRDSVEAALDTMAIDLGDFRLSALFVIRAIAVTAVLLWAAQLAATFFQNRIDASTELSPSFKVLAGKTVSIALTALAGIVALNAVGVDLTALTIFSGAVGVGIGFGLQKVVSNFISGIIILADKSIKPGDTIELQDTFGWIRELRARFVSVITRDGREYLIPNEDFITHQVVNWSFSDNYIRIDVDFGVAYDSNPHDVTRIAIEAAQTVERVTDAKKPVCWLTAFGSSSLDFKLRFWITDPQNGLTNIRGQVLLALWDAFTEAGIGIPYPHREIIMRSPVEIARQSPSAK